MRTLMLLATLFLSACAHAISPQTSGSHVAAVGQALAVDQKERYVVWSNHAGVGQYITGILLQGGHTVVERSKLQSVFAEQKIRLSHTPDEDVLRVGRLVGATQVIFAEVSSLERGSGMFATIPPVRVMVRSVSVESGTVLWSGMAAYAELTQNPEQSAVNLAYWAISRATCRVEDGAVWEEPSAKGGGCTWPTGIGKPTGRGGKPEPTIWGELRAQEMAKEYEWLSAEHRALEQQRVALPSEKDPAAQKRAFTEYMRRVAEYNKRLAVYEQQRATGQATGR